ncbi:MAG: hypothetical protein M3531_19180, partial [Pseudomonadota bacterium]|nr:hypothetical protein [Pseudomonadota bacterium]
MTSKPTLAWAIGHLSPASQQFAAAGKFHSVSHREGMVFRTNQGQSRFAGFFISRNFSLLWLGQALSSFGEYVLESTIIVWLVT